MRECKEAETEGKSDSRKTVVRRDFFLASFKWQVVLPYLIRQEAMHYLTRQET